MLAFILLQYIKYIDFTSIVKVLIQRKIVKSEALNAKP